MAAMAFPVELVVLVFLFYPTVGLVDSDDGKSPSGHSELKTSEHHWVFNFSVTE